MSLKKGTQKGNQQARQDNAHRAHEKGCQSCFLLYLLRTYYVLPVNPSVSGYVDKLYAVYCRWGSDSCTFKTEDTSGGDSAKVTSVTWERSLWGFLTNLIPHPKPATGNWANKGGLRVWGLDSKEPE